MIRAVINLLRCRFFGHDSSGCYRSHGYAYLHQTRCARCGRYVTCEEAAW